MAVKRIGIVLPMLGISGGINIVLNWGVILAKAGYHIDIILPPTVGRPEVPFLSEEDCKRLHLINENQARCHHYDTVIATWWATLTFMIELKADRYAWFMQAYEGQFFNPNSPAQSEFDELVASQMNVITIAPWLQQHILRHYNFEPKRTFCVLNALDKALWRPMPRQKLRKGGRRVSFLVEGPVSDPRKNTAQTIRMLEGLGVPYTWVGSVVDRSLVGKNCLRVEEKVPYRRMPYIYGSSDVLIKASNSEGMFGPPLEMFATGGTAAVWDVQGAEEYMAHRHNAYLVPMNSWPRLSEAILELAGDPARVQALQENALATAEAWPTWEDQTDQILSTIESLEPFGRCSLVRQFAKNQFRTVIPPLPPAVDIERLQLTNSRAFRLVRALQRARSRWAPDGTIRWACILFAGRVVWRTGRRMKSLRRAA